MAVTKTIESVWGGDEPMQTHYGPKHYIMVEFDDGTNASVGCNPDNLQRTREKLYELVGAEIEVKLELKDPDSNKYRLVGYPGSYNGKDLQVVTPRPEGFVYPPPGEDQGAPERPATSAASPPPPPVAPSGAQPTADEAVRLEHLLDRLSTALNRLDGMVDVIDAIIRVNTEPPPVDEVSKPLSVEEVTAALEATPLTEEE